MQIRNIEDIHSNFTVGDEVWACAFEYRPHKIGYEPAKSLYQKPIKGVFVTHRNGAKDKNNLKNGGNTRIKYFVPLKANGTELMYSKLVNLESRYYASTEQECNELYNEIIDENINWLKSQIEELEAEKVQLK